jgi:hypothetical protein
MHLMKLAVLAFLLSPVAAFAQRTQCTALDGASIPASAITLPTSGAKVTSASLLAASGSGTAAQPEYCKVLVDILPVDSKAQPIRIQVNLPSDWNGKAFHFGGGGFDGFLVTGEGRVPGSGAAFSTPLGRSYATFGSDGGHEGDPTKAFLNDETLENYMGAHLKKTHDVAVYLIKQRYGRAPTRIWFAGGSGGGREAFYAMQRMDDYTGIIAFYPAWKLNEMLLNYGRMSLALAKPGHFPNAEKQAFVLKKVMGACDGLDGVVDGLISNDKACTFEVKTLRCPSGADEGDTCLTDQQIATFETIASPMSLPYRVASGETTYPGFNILKGADPHGAMGSAPPVRPPDLVNGAPQAFASRIYDTYVQGWVARNPEMNALLLDPLAPGPFEDRVSRLSTMADIDSFDLSRFQQRGGKLLIVHGKADATIPTASGAEYYTRLQAKMGADKVSEFVRYYEPPGYAHGNGVFNISWDSLTVLENWVEKGIPPGPQVVTDSNPATAGRTRPLCEYPMWPKYKGQGDINDASNFVCVTE